MKAMLTVRHILTLDYFKNHRLLAGKNGLDHEVCSVATVEVPDVAAQLPPGAMIGTVASYFEDVNEFMNWIRSLHDAGVAAVSIKTGRYIDNVPEDVLRLADDLSIPIIQAPADEMPTEFIDTISRVLYQTESFEPQYSGNNISFFRRCFNYPELNANEQAAFLIGAEINGFILRQPFQLLVYPDGSKAAKLREKLYLQMLMAVHDYDPVAFGAQFDEHTLIIYHYNQADSDQSHSPAVREQMIQSCADLLSQHNLKLYISRKMAGADNIASAYQRMASCIRIDRSLNDFSPQSPVTCQNGILLELLDQMIKNPELSRDYVDRVLMDPIRDETPLRQKEIRQLLRVIFRHNGRLKDIAAYTNTHINTVQYRIQYIENVYQCDLRDHHTQFTLQLALILHAILKGKRV